MVCFIDSIFSRHQWFSARMWGISIVIRCFSYEWSGKRGVSTDVERWSKNERSESGGVVSFHELFMDEFLVVTDHVERLLRFFKSLV